MLCVLILVGVSQEMNRTYSELLTFPTYEERYRYLQIKGKVGEATFGFDRYLNQMFYSSKDWEPIRNSIIVRDYGRDLGIIGREIHGTIYVHHMNPISVEDIKNFNPELIDPKYLICTSLITHNAIHYGNEDNLIKDPIIRTRNDTCPWKQ